MTDQLFRPPTAEPPPLVPAERVGRWVLHRAGIHNVWQYDNTEVGFAGGRALLRGKNGAGKSKALEVLLPFLLDGDTRSIDAAGRDRTTVYWLMTDGRAPGQHIGYVWLELRLTSIDGQESFCTLGAGLRASTSTRRPDTWFFLTDRRVGLDLVLDPGGGCLALDPLKSEIGEEAVTTSAAEHRRRVGLRLFGLRDDGRYGNLLHLLHRLRDPNIGNRVEAGELASVLTDALPPLDDDVLTDAACRLDDLELIRQQFERTEQTASALGRFLVAYRGYTQTALRLRTGAVAEADRHRRRSARAARDLASQVAEAVRAAEATEARLDHLRNEERSALSERDALRESEAYRSHLDLAHRRRTVEARRETAVVAGRAAAEALGRRAEAAADVDAAASAVADRSATATTSHHRLGRAAADAGVESVLLPPPVTGVDGAVVGATARALESAAGVIDVRRRQAEEVRRLGVAWRRAADLASIADEDSARSEAELVAAQHDADASESALRDASRQWAGEVRAWSRLDVAVRSGSHWQELLSLAAADDPVGREVPSKARVLARKLLAPALATARLAAAAAGSAASQAEAALAAEQEARRRVEAEVEARPSPGRRRAERDAAAGAPFYELVDLSPALEADAAAGIEAALEAAGILDAWVTADGVVAHPRTEDVLITTAGGPPPEGTPTLAGVLMASPEGDGSSRPVAVATVERMLGTIVLGEHDTWPTWVAADGRWSTGVLRGAWSKPEVEFLGAGARRATRRRRLSELAASIERLQAVLDEARRALVAAQARVDALDALPESFPGDAALVAAHNGLDVATRVASGARERHAHHRRAAEAARTSAARARAELDHAASADGLPTDADALDALLSALREAKEAVGDHGRRLRDLVEAIGRLDGQRAHLAARQAEAESSGAESELLCRQAEESAAELATLEAALGASVRDVLDQLSAAEARVAQAVDELPRATKADKEAGEHRVRVTEHHRQAEATLGEAEQAVIGAGEVLLRAVLLPGVALAALGRQVVAASELVEGTAGMAPAASAVALADTLAAMVGEGDGVTDRLILARYDELQEALAGGYDTAADEDDGVKVFHVADDSGRQPLAVVAARVAGEAEAARGRLAEREREVLERFLLRELADELHDRLLEATDLVADANRALAGVRTSHGKGARVEWHLGEDAPPAASSASRLLIDDLRTEADDAALRDALLDLIGAEREADPTAGYEQHLRRALDYRSWYEFRVRVVDDDRPGSSRALTARAGLSQGEQRVLSYLVLFAATSAHFDALARTCPEAPRLLLLDDAFAKVDEPTHGRLLELLVTMNLDFLITSERLWGCFAGVPSLEIYEALRDPNVAGVAFVHFHWDGHHRHLVGL